jgi:hypothetical protein
MTEVIFDKLLEHGVTGLAAGVFLWLYLLKDKELTKERGARIEDAQKFTTVALGLQERALSSVEKLSNILEEVRKK